MQKLIIILSAVFSISAHANLESSNVCASFARGAAESLYLTEATGIQGHTYDSVVVGYIDDKKNEWAHVTVQVSGSNDEGDSWESNFVVTVSVPSCKIIEINPKE